MSAPALLLVASVLLAAGGAWELLLRAGREPHQATSPPAAGDLGLLPFRLLPPATRRGLGERIARGGLADTISVPAVLLAKCGCALAGLLCVPVLAPLAPGRLTIVVAVALPVAAFLAPDALLERRARLRAREFGSALPDALDLLATAAAAGRSPLAGFAEVAAGEGALARELAVVVADASCGTSQARALERLRRRIAAPELAGMCAAIERSRRHGSPLADQLRDQAGSLRGSQRRQIAEHAARAAPKIQLAVALLLVPSVLAMIAAGLLANADRFLAGI